MKLAEREAQCRSRCLVGVIILISVTVDITTNKGIIDSMEELKLFVIDGFSHQWRMDYSVGKRGESMQISSRFTIGTHVLVMIALKGDCTKVTSDMIAESVGVNPVIIRKTLSPTKKAGLIHVARGNWWG